jgi:hypothetical protein
VIIDRVVGTDNLLAFHSLHPATMTVTAKQPSIKVGTTAHSKSSAHLERPQLNGLLLGHRCALQASPPDLGSRRNPHVTHQPHYNRVEEDEVVMQHQPSKSMASHNDTVVLTPKNMSLSSKDMPNFGRAATASTAKGRPNNESEVDGNAEVCLVPLKSGWSRKHLFNLADVNKDMDTFVSCKLEEGGNHAMYSVKYLGNVEEHLGVVTQKRNIPTRSHSAVRKRPQHLTDTVAGKALSRTKTKDEPQVKKEEKKVEVEALQQVEVEALKQVKVETRKQVELCNTGPELSEVAIGKSL